MWSTRAKRAPRPGAAGRVLAQAASAVLKSGHGPSSAVTRSMSAGVFPPTSSRSTRPRTSTRAPEFAGYSGLHQAVSQRIGPDISATAAGPTRSHRWFPGSPGDQGFVPTEPAEPRMGGLTVRGPTVRLLVRGLTSSPSPPLFSPEPTPSSPPCPLPLLPHAHSLCSPMPTPSSPPCPPLGRVLLRSPRSLAPPALLTAPPPSPAG